MEYLAGLVHERNRLMDNLKASQKEVERLRGLLVQRSSPGAIYMTKPQDDIVTTLMGKPVEYWLGLERTQKRLDEIIKNRRWG